MQCSTVRQIWHFSFYVNCFLQVHARYKLIYDQTWIKSTMIDIENEKIKLHCSLYVCTCITPSHTFQRIDISLAYQTFGACIICLYTVKQCEISCQIINYCYISWHAIVYRVQKQFKLILITYDTINVLYVYNQCIPCTAAVRCTLILLTWKINKVKNDHAKSKMKHVLYQSLYIFYQGVNDLRSGIYSTSHQSYLYCFKCAFFSINRLVHMKHIFLKIKYSCANQMLQDMVNQNF